MSREDRSVRMNQYPHGYGPYENRSQPLPVVHLQPQARPQEYAPHQHGVHATEMIESFTSNRSVIPGLAFSTPISAGVFERPWPALPSNESSPAHYPPSTLLPERRDGATATIKSSAVHPVPSAPVDDILEEGELSEGEFDDLYEPRPASESGNPQHLPVVSQVAAAEPSYIPPVEGPTHDVPVHQKEHQATGPSATYPAGELVYYPYDEYWQPTIHLGRERSGSYSPYLSPGEIRNFESTTNSSRYRGLGKF
jgi:hypothetical protein